MYYKMYAKKSRKAEVRMKNNILKYVWTKGPTKTRINNEIQFSSLFEQILV